MTRLVHLLGSIPLDDTDAVFSAVGETLGSALDRVPDGETGARLGWIGWQHGHFAGQAAFERTAASERDYQQGPPYRLRAGANAEDISFGSLGYAETAIAAYAAFVLARNNGMFQPECRFQVALPTPFAPVYAFMAYEDQGAVMPLYEARMRTELDEILAAIPHDDLAVQWDVATEMSIFERLHPVPFLGDRAEKGLLDALVRLADWVPEGVSLGYHLCYGSMNNRHWKEPEDTGVMTRVANAVAAEVSRPIDWLHMPVPVDRDDDAYFAPLRDLSMATGTRLFLGLLHPSDGIDGARRRIAAAEKFVSGFGVGAECGFGRYDPASIPEVLRLHAEAARI